jgi:hypothetical protein
MKQQRLALFLAFALLAGCGGGGSGGSSVPNTAAKTQPQAKGSVTISIPTSAGSGSSAKVRYPQFVSPNAESVALSINGAADLFFDVSSSSSLCVTVAGTRNCTLSFGAPAGSDTFAFLIFAGPNGAGTQLASAATTQQIGPGFNFTVALNAAVGTIVIAIPASHGNQNCPAQPNFAGQNFISEGCGGTGTVTIAVDDPSGATITGSAPYAVPITLTTNDPSFVLSAPQITAPGQAETIIYSGAPFAAGITNLAVVTATAGGQSAQANFLIRRSYLYVANSNDTIGSGTPPAGGGNVSVYTYGASGGGAPLRTYTGGASLLQTPVKPLVDANGNLYVLDIGIPVGPNYDPTILVYGPQTATGSISPPPLRQISHFASIGALSGCTDMEFDPTGQYLFVACQTQVNVFPITANGIASSVFSTEFYDEDLSTQTALAFDPNGNLYIADDNLNVIDIVGAPLATTGAYHPVAGNLGSIAASSGAWPATLRSFSMFIDNTGALFAPFFYLNSGSGPPDAQAELAIWPGTTLPCINCAPAATLTGTPFNVHAVAGITMDPEGEAYVVNNTTNAVSIFGPTAVRGSSASNVAPSRTILNSSQGASGPLGMTVGP